MIHNPAMKTALPTGDFFTKLCRVLVPPTHVVSKELLVAAIALVLQRVERGLGLSTFASVTAPFLLFSSSNWDIKAAVRASSQPLLRLASTTDDGTVVASIVDLLAPIVLEDRDSRPECASRIERLIFISQLQGALLDLFQNEDLVASVMPKLAPLRTSISKTKV